MLQRLFTQCLVRPQDLTPSCPEMQVVSAFNPGVVRMGDRTILMVRVAEKPRQTESGHTALPRYEPGGRIAIDHVPIDQLEPLDPRMVRQRKDGCVRLTFTSHLRVLISADGRRIESESDVRFVPQLPYETYGVEDPRITPIDDRFYFTYVAVSPYGAATALASTCDFVTFERHGIIFHPENKDVLLFPRKIGGRYAALHRPNPAQSFAQPQMWLAWSRDLTHWGEHQPLLRGGSAWEAGRIGGGCPPILTDRGWLEIYHGNDRTPRTAGVGAYCAATILMDRDDPSRIIARSDQPILAPDAPFEIDGFVPNVVFPTAVIEQDDELLVYYGAADTVTAVVGLRRRDVLAVCREN